jgi:hypothetical protein
VWEDKLMRVLHLYQTILLKTQKLFHLHSDVEGDETCGGNYEYDPQHSEIWNK